MDSNTPQLEKLDYRFEGRRQMEPFAPVLVGVVGSGNLEVMMEPGDAGKCTFHVETSARGFGTIWEAVCRDFHERQGLAGVAVSINDMGATPAVVSLRLMQAATELTGSTP